MTDTSPPPGNRAADGLLSQGRLLVALDALLSRRNVTLAARDLGLQPSGLSRILGQLRVELGDPLFIRSGRGLVPTPFAEELRPHVHAVATGLRALFAGQSPAAMPPPPCPTPSAAGDPSVDVPSPIAAPPLAARAADHLEGQPTVWELNARLDRIANDASAHRRLARHVGVLGIAGGGQGRPLTVEEAGDAMTTILDGEADPVQIGALLGMLRLRGSTAPELAGFAKAAQDHVAARLGTGIDADLDWPCYTSPNYHNPPWFFHAARLVARAGYRVVLHGSTGTGDSGGRHDMTAAALDIPCRFDAAGIGAALDHGNIVYVPLAGMAPQIYRLTGLYRCLQSRTVINEMVHLLCPTRVRLSLLGVAKPTYRHLHRDTAKLLGWHDVAIVGGGRDVAQATPFRLTTLLRLVDGIETTTMIPALMREPAATPRPRCTSLDHWQGVWSGAFRDHRAEHTIVATAALALMCLANGDGDGFAPCLERAADLWRDRLTAPAVTSPRRRIAPSPHRESNSYAHK